MSSASERLTNLPEITQLGGRADSDSDVSRMGVGAAGALGLCGC